MQSFTFYNPVRIVFGQQSIARLSGLLDRQKRVLLLYGGGSIKSNGVYDQVQKALKGRILFEFGGIEANPRYETLMLAVDKVRKEKIDFLLAVGGGSVVDGSKFIAAAAHFPGDDPWDILARGAKIENAVPLGAILTLPATGSEMNSFAVISRESTHEKLAFGSEWVLPKFSILDPAVTLSLPRQQLVNGIVDAYVHVMEQYMTYPVNSPLQDRQAEAIWSTLIEEAPAILGDEENLAARANLMWCATQALNGLISCGVPQDWTSHQIGHELTAFYSIDHAPSLALALPAVLRHQRRSKAVKLRQYGARIWQIRDADADKAIDAAIERTIEFFDSLGMPVRRRDYGITDEHFQAIAERIDGRGERLGEHRNLGKNEILEILQLID